MIRLVLGIAVDYVLGAKAAVNGMSRSSD